MVDRARTEAGKQLSERMIGTAGWMPEAIAAIEREAARNATRLFTLDRDLLLEFVGWLAEQHSHDVYYVVDEPDYAVTVIDEFLHVMNG